MRMYLGVPLSSFAELVRYFEVFLTSHLLSCFPESMLSRDCLMLLRDCLMITRAVILKKLSSRLPGNYSILAVKKTGHLNIKTKIASEYSQRICAD